MNKKTFQSPVKSGCLILLITLVFSLPAGAMTKKPVSRPNIVFILVDDMGWKDLGCYGSAFYETPNIDKLASQGMRFTDAYASSTVCSPSRSSIMTGQYPVHTGITDWIIGSQNGSGPRPDQKLLPRPFTLNLDTSQVTIAEALKHAGYATCFAGKWHLGLSPAYWPENQGFDYNYGGWAAGNPRAHGMGGYFSPYHNPKLKDGPEGEFLPDRLTTEIIGFIKEQVKRKKPFFADLSFYAVHQPIEAKEKYIKKFKEKAHRMGLDTLQQFVKDEQWMQRRTGWKERMVQSNPVYAGLIYSVDENVGRIITTLKELGIFKNTVILFTSDNGGLSTAEGAPTANYPLRYGKGWAYEGGIRVPLIIRWPNVIREGTICHFPVVNTDFYPTLLQMAGLPLMPEQHRDGVSLVPLLKGGKSLAGQSVIYWHYPHYSNQGGIPSSFVRVGDWKLIQFYEDNHIELYNLRTDLEERRNLVKALPDKAAAMTEMLNQWKYDVHAKIPWINPYYDPYIIDHYINQHGKKGLSQFLRDYDTLFSKEVYDPNISKSLSERYHKLYNLR